MRVVLSRLLTALGVALLVLGMTAGVVNREVLDSDRFLTHVDGVRADPPVARALGRLVTDRVLAANPDLTAVRPLLEATAAAVVASPSTSLAARAAVAPLHQSLTGESQGSVVLRLADLGAVIVASATTLSPQVEATLPPDLDVRLSELGGQDLSQEVVWQAHLTAWLARLAPGLGLVLLFVAGWIRAPRSGRLRDALASVGRGAVAAGSSLVLLLVVIGFLVSRVDEEELTGALQRAVWAELSASFWTAAALVASIGVLLVLTTRRRGLPDPRSLPRTLSTPGRRWSPAVVVGSLALGGALVLQPSGVLRVLAQFLGFTLLLLGVVSLFSSAAGAVRARAASRRTGQSDRPRRGRSRTAIAVGVVALMVSYVLGAVPADDLDVVPSAATDTTTCNGHVELCQRRFDEVAFPATHNSMAAAAEPGWFFAEQPDGIIRQLDHGIRVLLIDSWYAQRTSRPGVVANSDADRAAAVDEVRRTLGPDAVDSAARLRDALELRPRGPVEPYLCHGLCVLGSTAWLPVMEEVAEWMRSHPREVVTFFVQDQVSPTDTAELVERAGLRSLVHQQQQGEPWPTLGSMIDSGRRLVILMENRSGGQAYPWLLDGFAWVQDTPFDFRTPAEFSCAPNRGAVDAPLFLLNHWITDKAREVTNARTVNAKDVLLARAEECRAVRQLLPNFVAVDFYDQGDLLAVVDELNGL